MADIYTPNLNLTKPEPNGSQHTWGSKLNTNFDIIDAIFPAQKLQITNGGTGSDNAADARAALEIGTLAMQNASNVSVGALTVSNFFGIGVSSSTYLCEVSGNAKALTGTFASVSGNNVSLAGAIAPTVSASTRLTVANSNLIKENSRPVYVAAAGYKSNIDLTIYPDAADGPVWNTKEFDTIGTAIGSNSRYIVQIPQGFYLMNFRAYISGVGPVRIPGQLSVNDAYAYRFDTFVTPNYDFGRLFLSAFLLFYAPASGTANFVKVVLWNYSGNDFVVKGNSEYGVRIDLVRIK